MQKEKYFQQFFSAESNGGRSKAEIRLEHADASSIYQHAGLSNFSNIFFLSKKLTIIILITANASAVPKCIFYSEKDCCTS